MEEVNKYRSKISRIRHYAKEVTTCEGRVVEIGSNKENTRRPKKLGEKVIYLRKSKIEELKTKRNQSRKLNVEKLDLEIKKLFRRAGGGERKMEKRERGEVVWSIT